MSSKATLYRRSKPEYYEEEKIKDRQRMKNKYTNDPEYREYKKNQSKIRYQQLKAEKEANKIQNLYETQLENSVEEFLQNFQ